MEPGPAVNLHSSGAYPVVGGNNCKPTPIRLADVDRFLVVRQGVRRMLAAMPDIVLVAEADSAQIMIDFLLRRSANVLLIDPEFGIPSARNVLEAISYRIPTLRIVMFATDCSDSDIDFALRIEAAGYILKSTQAFGLVTAIRRAANKSTYFCDEATARMVAWDFRRNHANLVSRLATLTNRETSVLMLLSEGLATKRIAYEPRYFIENGGQSPLKDHVKTQYPWPGRIMPNCRT